MTLFAPAKVKRSFTSGIGEFPVKILRDVELVRTAVEEQRVLLRHLHLCPTNRCNLDCGFCAYSDRDRSQELPFDELAEVLEEVSSLGCRATTISGGGEPLLHPRIADIVSECVTRGIQVGLVTNGLLLDGFPSGVTWCRVSLSTSRDFRPMIPLLERAFAAHPQVDWSFSYVLESSPPRELRELVEFANAYDCTHVRVASEVYHPSTVFVDEARALLQSVDERVIYWLRDGGVPGVERCWVSLLKPVLAANGKVYPCCAIQHAVRSPHRDFTRGVSHDFRRVHANQECFDGSSCTKCYYSYYNLVLQALLEGVCHELWV